MDARVAVNVAADLFGAKENICVMFSLPLPPIEEVLRTVGHVYQVELEHAKPEGVEVEAVPRFVVQYMQFFNATAQEWVDITESAQLYDGIQVFAFQPRSDVHSDNQAMIPVAKTPILPFPYLHLDTEIPRSTVVPQPSSTPAAHAAPAFQQQLDVFKRFDPSSSGKGCVTLVDIHACLKTTGLGIRPASVAALFGLAPHPAVKGRGQHGQHDTRTVSLEEWLAFCEGHPCLGRALCEIVSGQAPPNAVSLDAVLRTFASFDAGLHGRATLETIRKGFAQVGVDMSPSAVAALFDRPPPAGDKDLRCVTLEEWAAFARTHPHVMRGVATHLRDAPLARSQSPCAVREPSRSAFPSPTRAPASASPVRRAAPQQPAKPTPRAATATPRAAPTPRAVSATTPRAASSSKPKAGNARKPWGARDPIPHRKVAVSPPTTVRKPPAKRARCPSASSARRMGASVPPLSLQPFSAPPSPHRPTAGHDVLAPPVPLPLYPPPPAADVHALTYAAHPQAVAAPSAGCLHYIPGLPPPPPAITAHAMQQTLPDPAEQPQPQVQLPTPLIARPMYTTPTVPLAEAPPAESNVFAPQPPAPPPKEPSRWAEWVPPPPPPPPPAPALPAAAALPTPSLPSRAAPSSVAGPPAGASAPSEATRSASPVRQHSLGPGAHASTRRWYPNLVSPCL